MTESEADALARSNAAALTAMAGSLAALLAEIRGQSNALTTRQQQLWFLLYEKHLKLRLGPTVITSNTADTVLDDIVRDALRMTDLLWPQVQAALDLLE